VVGSRVVLKIRFKDSSGVLLLQLGSCLNTAPNGSESGNLGLDFFSIIGISIGIDIVERVALGLSALLRVELGKGCWARGCAVSADVLS